MIDRLIEFSARQRGTVIGLVLTLAIWGGWSIRQIPLDALPDLGETQVILYSRWDRSPDLIEDQPFSAIGAIWSLYLLGYPISPAVWVGLIALLGVDAETGTFMVLYLDLAWRKCVAEGRMARMRICAKP